VTFAPPLFAVFQQDAGGTRRPRILRRDLHLPRPCFIPECSGGEMLRSRIERVGFHPGRDYLNPTRRFFARPSRHGIRQWVTVNHGRFAGDAGEQRGYPRHAAGAAQPGKGGASPARCIPPEQGAFRGPVHPPTRNPPRFLDLRPTVRRLDARSGFRARHHAEGARPRSLRPIPTLRGLDARSWALPPTPRAGASAPRLPRPAPRHAGPAAGARPLHPDP